MKLHFIEDFWVYNVAILFIIILILESWLTAFRYSSEIQKMFFFNIIRFDELPSFEFAFVN